MADSGVSPSTMRRMKDSRFSRGSRGSVVQAESAIVRVASRCAANSAGGSDFQAAAFRLRGDFAWGVGLGAKTSATASAAGADWGRFAAAAASRAASILARSFSMGSPWEIE